MKKLAVIWGNTQKFGRQEELQIASSPFHARQRTRDIPRRLVRLAWKSSSRCGGRDKSKLRLLLKAMNLTRQSSFGCIEPRRHFMWRDSPSPHRGTLHADPVAALRSVVLFLRNCACTAYVQSAPETPCNRNAAGECMQVMVGSPQPSNESRPLALDCAPSRAMGSINYFAPR